MQLYLFYNVATILQTFTTLFTSLLHVFVTIMCKEWSEAPVTHSHTDTNLHICAIAWNMSSFCPTLVLLAASIAFCIVDPFLGTVGICGYLTCIGLSGQGKGKSCSLKLERDGPLLSANASYQASAVNCRLLCGPGCFGLLIRLFVCLFPGAPERKPVRSGPSRFTSVRSWNSVLTSLSLLITCPWPPLRHRWLNFICYSRSIKSLRYSGVTVFVMHFYHGHSQRCLLRVLLLQYNECSDKKCTV